MEKSFLFLSSERSNAFLREEVEKSCVLLRNHQASTQSPNIPILRSIRVEKGTSEDGVDKGEIINTLHNWGDEDENIPHADTSIEKDEEVRINDFLQLADALHCFADTCEAGKTLLDVIWCIEKYAPCSSEVVEYYGALQRLLLWFNASLSIIVKDPSIVEDWLSTISFNVVDCSSKVLNQRLSLSWRGSLGLTFEDKNEMQLYPELSLTFENQSLNPFISEDCTYNGSVYALPVAEIFSQVDIGTIHLTNIHLGSICFFQVSDTCDDAQKAVLSELFNLLEKPGIGTLMRIRYASSAPKFEGVPSLKTEKWKEAVVDGHDGSISFHFKGYHSTATFLILPEAIMEGKVYAFLLQDSTAIGDDVMNLAIQELNKSPVSEDPAKKELIVDLLKDTPLFTNVHLVTLGKLLYHLPKELKEHLEKKGQNPNALCDALKNRLEVTSSQELFRHLMMFPFSKFILSSTQKTKPEYTAPMDTWPEYEALVEAEKANQRSLDRCHSGDFLAGLPPPPSIDSIVYLDADQLLKLFTPEGDPTEAVKKKMIKIVPKRMMHFKPAIPLETAKQAPWSEAFHLKHHGIYYNRNFDDEKFETSCNRTRERYIRHETASTCSAFREKESSYVTLSNGKHTSVKPGKVKTSDRKPRSQFDFQKRPTKASSKVDLKGDKCASTSKAIIRKRPLKPVAAIAESTLRRSPRKKMSTNPNHVRPSDLLTEPTARSRRSASTAQKNPKPADLSDAHKQKLRNAVLTSLEAEGISMKHQLFKFCFKKLFVVCKPFALDVVGLGSTSSNLEKIAKAHVKQVIEFEKLKVKKR